MKSETSKFPLLGRNYLLGLWEHAFHAIDPIGLFRPPKSPKSDEAILCWGKAAFRTWEGLNQRGFNGPASLIIAPKGAPEGAPEGSESPAGMSVFLGEHPLPGSGSFRAGEGLLDFFDFLRRVEVKKLRIFLSGGASSLAWIKPALLSEEELHLRLRQLYSRALDISKLNRERAKLCALKSGGAARWLKRLSPSTQAQVEVISDVLPFGPEVVGSGPFWDGKIQHRVRADNQVLLRSLASRARKDGLRILSADFETRLGPWQHWVRELKSLIRKSLRANEDGLILRGGEPSVALPKHLSPRARGGRQTQIALALALEFSKEIASGQIEILCSSSDGVDGHSGAAGAFLNVNCGKKIVKARASSSSSPHRHLDQFDSATLLGHWGALIPAKHSGSNVQDVVIVWVRSSAIRASASSM